MYDSLEGLDWEYSELQPIVSRILKDVDESLRSDYLKRISVKDVQVGDVIISDYSSHLVTDKSRIHRTINKDRNLLVITKDVLADFRVKQ